MNHVSISGTAISNRSNKSVSSTSFSTEPIECLAGKHQQAVESGKTSVEIWQMLYDDPWFQRRLTDAARFCVLRHHLPAHNTDDVKQDALVQIARAIERDLTLGYRAERGNYGAFMATIIHRSCQKGLRQFRKFGSGLSIHSEFLHPEVDPWDELDEQIDLEASIPHVPEPYRGVIQKLCEGQTIEQIADEQDKSVRTIYRYLNQAIECLRSLLPE